MGRSNGCEANRKRADAKKRMEKATGKGSNSQLAANEKAMTLKCKICMQTFMGTQKSQLPAHVDGKHPKNKWEDCFPDIPNPKAQYCAA